jgi:hypothetical protein
MELERWIMLDENGEVVNGWLNNAEPSPDITPPGWKAEKVMLVDLKAFKQYVNSYVLGQIRAGNFKSYDLEGNEITTQQTTCFIVDKK